MKGKKAEVGDRRVSQNGYSYVRTEECWELEHRLVAEEKLGRKLEDNEYVAFLDGNKQNLAPSNLKVRKRKNKTAERKAHLQRQIETLQARLSSLS